MRFIVAVLALGAGSCALAQTLTGSNGFYDVAVTSSGEYTARTGALHPGPVGVNVLYGGAALAPGTSWNSVRSYASAREYVLRGFPVTPSPGFRCMSINGLPGGTITPMTDAGGATTGAEVVWSVVSGIDAFTVREQVNAEGSTFESSVVRVTLCVRNDGTVMSDYGLRMMWDWQVSGNDGPFLGTRPPNPPTEPLLSAETDWIAPAFGSYDISDRRNPTTTPPTYRVGGTVNEPPLAPPPTHPDFLQYIGWDAANATCFETPNAGSTIGSESILFPTDSAVSYFWGSDAASTIPLGPGEEFCATQYLFVFTLEPPPLCQITARLSAGAACSGGTVTLDGSGSSSSDCAGALDYKFLDSAGGLVQDWSADPTVDVTTSDTYTLEVRCASDTSCQDRTEAVVNIEVPPEPFTIGVQDADPCNSGLLVRWTGDWAGTAWGSNGPGTFTLRRSTVDCADAQAQPPLATGLTLPQFIDLSASGGVPYTYHVTAEAANPALSCPPGPERGAPFTKGCVSAPAIDDVPAPAPDAIGPALRVRRPASQPLLYWETAPPLRAAEFDVVLSSLDPRTLNQTATGITTLEYEDIPAVGKLIFYKVVRSNVCGVLSSD